MFIKQKNLACIPREHKPFWQLNRLGDLFISEDANLLVHETLNNLLPKIFLYTFRRGCFSQEKIDKIKGRSFANVC